MRVWAATWHRQPEMATKYQTTSCNACIKTEGLRETRGKPVVKSGRLSEIEGLAEFIAESFFPDDRIEPEIIAEKNGLSYNYGRYANAFDGMLEYLDGEFHIYVNLDRVKSPAHARSRFTFCHELGHFYIDDHRNALISGIGPHASFTDYQSKNPAEQEADSFAAALLMPAGRFQAAARRRRPGIDAIHQLVNMFGTSYASTAIRYAKSDTHSVLAMLWTGDKRKWCWSSEDMRRLTDNRIYKSATKLPPGSLTDLAIKGENTTEKVIGSSLAAWCPFIRAGSKNDQIMVEEAMSLGEFGVLTLLYPD